PIQDSLRPTAKEGPSPEGPGREFLGDGGAADRRVVLHGLAPFDELRMRDDPTDSEAAEAAQRGDGRKGDHPRTELGDARRGATEGQTAERFLDRDVRNREGVRQGQG